MVRIILTNRRRRKTHKRIPLCCWLLMAAASRPLSPEEQKVLELTQLAGLDIREDAFLTLWELMQLDASAVLVLQLLKQLAGDGLDGSPRSSKSQDSRALLSRSN